MRCLRQNNDNNSKFRLEAKDYLGCRMQNNLMEKTQWSKLGFEYNNIKAHKRRKYKQKLIKKLIGEIGDLINLEKCVVALSTAANSDNHEQIISIRKKIKSLMKHINHVKDELYKHKDLATMSEKYWRNVEKARNCFIEEIESIFPGLNLSDQKLNLSKEDLDLFIMHVYSHVLVYQKELQRLQTDGELTLKRAVEAFRGDSDSEAVKAQLDFLECDELVSVVLGGFS